MLNDVYADLEWRGAVHQITDPHLPDVLREERVTLYCGFDPTADSLHVGGLLQLLNLRRMQLAGHRPIAVLGGGTGLVGDPSGKESERVLLPQQALDANAERIAAQISRLLDFGPGSPSALLLNNAEWLRPLRLTDFLRDIGKHFSVNVMISRESVRTRLEQREQGISFTEFAYMLLQAYDFLHLYDEHDCRLQMGGSDQWGNITSGIDLIRRMRDGQAYGLTSPLIEGLPGAKMGKSEKGNVWLDPQKTSPYRFYQYWLNVEDRHVIRLLKLFTFLDRRRIDELTLQVEEQPARREAQRTLAAEVTTIVHGGAETEKAIRASKALFGVEISELDENDLLEVLADAPSTRAGRNALANGGKPLVDLLVEVGLAESKSAARQYIKGGGVYINNVRHTDPEVTLSERDLLLGRYLVLRRGKKSHHLMSFE
ncbi:MAG: tyrosine--tRNA ligase [Actinomycetota bacterium]|nr:tyrosine--tRNA ligase [Actinomycetota bacterium]